MQQIELEIAARKNVRSAPRVTYRIDRQSTLPRGNEVVTVTGVYRRTERSSIFLRARGIPPIRSLGRSGKQQVDRRGNRFDMRKFFGRDVAEADRKRAEAWSARES